MHHVLSLFALMGTKFPGWTIVDSLDEGGQAQVFRVRRSGGIAGPVYVLKRLKNADDPV